MKSVSVCINTCDRVAYLHKLLNSLAMQTHMDFELVIVDDGVVVDSRSNALIKDSIEYLEEVTGNDVVEIKNPVRLGLARSRNIAADAASGEVIVKLDDDHYCDSAFVQRLVEAFDEKPDAGCVGAIFPFIKHGITVTNADIELFGDMSDRGWEDRQLSCYSGWSSIVEAETVRGIMAYVKTPKVKHNEDLTYISHREDTIFSLEFLMAGYKNYVHTQAIAYHLYAGKGGCRSFAAKKADVQRNKDNKIFSEIMKKYNEFKTGVADGSEE